ncbi:MAG: 50S ribosomal protein L24 [Flavobacteriaceae bacterium TMED212]|nr:MAG: 50S ribosomal protein L24 [Flavobacteriaceae bacterium TMED212]|tara:strand:+ start:608 stop:919 length:312 start_codon:yes stop_codon:yes gene_type:complete
MAKIKIKTDDRVLVIAGENKGSEGKVVSVIRDQNKAIVEGVNLIKKHAKPSAQNPQGGIIEKEAPIHISNLSLTTADGEATRVGFRMEDENKVRFAKKNNEKL